MALMLLWVFSSSCGEVVKGWRKKLSTQEIECFEIYVAKNKKAFLPRDRAEIGTEESPLPKLSSTTTKSSSQLGSFPANEV